MVRCYEFSDFLMDSKYGLSPGQHIPGIVMHRYHKDYRNHHGLISQIIFETRVVEIEKLGNGAWKVRAQVIETIETVKVTMIVRRS
jgi:hypothetical protein